MLKKDKEYLKNKLYLIKGNLFNKKKSKESKTIRHTDINNKVNDEILSINRILEELKNIK